MTNWLILSFDWVNRNSWLIYWVDSLLVWTWPYRLIDNCLIVWTLRYNNTHWHTIPLNKRDIPFINPLKTVIYPETIKNSGETLLITILRFLKFLYTTPLSHTYTSSWPGSLLTNRSAKHVSISFFLRIFLNFFLYLL